MSVASIYYKMMWSKVFEGFEPLNDTASNMILKTLVRTISLLLIGIVVVIFFAFVGILMRFFHKIDPIIALVCVIPLVIVYCRYIVKQQVRIHKPAFICNLMRYDSLLRPYMFKSSIFGSSRAGKWTKAGLAILTEETIRRKLITCEVDITGLVYSISIDAECSKYGSDSNEDSPISFFSELLLKIDEMIIILDACHSSSGKRRALNTATKMQDAITQWLHQEIIFTNHDKDYDKSITNIVKLNLELYTAIKVMLGAENYQETHW